MKTTALGTRLDRKTGQFFPTVDGKDVSPSSFSQARALEIARQVAYKASESQAATVRPLKPALPDPEGFTPGPWITRSYPNARGEIVCAKVWAGDEFSGSYVCAIASGDVDHNMSMAEGCANARLIAAAPDLLEALQLVWRWAEEQRTIEYKKPDNAANQDLLDDICRQARAAIAKATE